MRTLLLILLNAWTAQAQFGLRGLVFDSAPRGSASGPTCTNIQFAALTTYTNAVDATSYTTASYAPTDDALLLAVVVNDKASSPTAPTFSGNNVTWDSVTNYATFDTISGSTKRISVFRAQGDAISGAGTADFGGATQDGCIISVCQFRYVQVGGNGAAAILVKTNLVEDAGRPGVFITAQSPTNAYFIASADNSTSGSFVTPSGWSAAMTKSHVTVPADGGGSIYLGAYAVYRLAGVTNSNTEVFMSNTIGIYHNTIALEIVPACQ